jgi:hypothetical protein
MTLTVELSPEVEAQLKARAEQAGQDINTYAQRVLSRDAAAGAMTIEAAIASQTDIHEGYNLPSPNAAEATRLAAIDEGMGKFAHLKERGFNSAMIRAEREKDKQREERFNDTTGKRAA